MSAGGMGRRVAVIGTGRVGTAMAVLLQRRDFSVTVFDISEPAMARSVGLAGVRTAGSAAGAAAAADAVLLTVPDGAIEEACGELAGSGVALEGALVAHMSGALPLSVLAPAAAAGAKVASIHPLHTFADVEGALEGLPGSSFGVTTGEGADEAALELVSALDGRAIPVEDRDKALYHAAAVVACNLLVMLQHAAARVARELGLDGEGVGEFTPLVKATVENVERLGPTEALTGPLARGDAGTLEMNMAALERVDPELKELYRVVSLWGLRLVEERGELSPEELDAMRGLLEG